MIPTIFIFSPLFWFAEPAKCAKTGLAIKPHLHDHYNNSIAIDASSFTDLIQRSEIFVDNSMLIRELIDMDAHQQTILWQGPSNWGKTMNMDMVKMFFEMQFDEKGIAIPKESTNAYKFFVNGEIVLDDGTIQKLQTPPLISAERDQSGTSYIEFMARNPVIHVSFKHVKGKDIATMKQQIQSAIIRAFKVHQYLTNQSLPHKLKDHLYNKDSIYVGYSLRHLCEKLSVHVNRTESVIMLIEDFDTLFLNLLTLPYTSTVNINEIFTILENLFTHTIHYETGKGCLYRTIVTSKYKLQRHSYDKEFHLIQKDESLDQYFGFNEVNVRLLLEKHKITEELAQEVLNYYGTDDPSQISQQRFYNPVSIATFLQTKTFNSHRNSLIRFMLDMMFAKHLNLHGDAWFNQQELLLFKTLIKSPIYIKTEAQFSFEHIDILVRNNNLYRQSKRIGYENKCYIELCLRMLFGEGYFTKIPSTNQTKVLNNDMAVSLTNYLMKFYLNYCVHVEYIDMMIPILGEFLVSNINTTASLEDVLANIHDLRKCYWTKWETHFYLLRTYALRILLRLQFNIDTHYQKIPTADLIMIDNKIRQAVVFKIFDRRWKNNTAEVPEHEPVLQLFSHLRTVKLIGIHISLTNRPKVVIKIIAS